MVSSNRSKAKLFDPIRNQWVNASPEEIVRQKILTWMLSEAHGGYPRASLCVEKDLGGLPTAKPFHRKKGKLRFDIAVFIPQSTPSCRSAQGLCPSFTCALLIECKAHLPSLNAKLEALSQILCYSKHLCPHYIAIAASDQIYYRRAQNSNNTPHQDSAYFDGLPTYRELCSFIEEQRSA